MSRIDFKTKLLEKLEDGLLEWEDVCRECIAEMSTDQVEDMCDYCDYFLDEEDEQNYNEQQFMKVTGLIKKLETLDPEAEVQYKTCVQTIDAQGFTKFSPGWKDIDEKNVFTTRFGGRTVFIGDPQQKQTCLSVASDARGWSYFPALCCRYIF